VSSVVTFTVVYDNNAYNHRLRTAWGFACLVEREDVSLLFDTGGDSPTLLSNMAALGIDPTEIDVVVLSHIHGDHTGGLGGLLAVNDHLTVYVPRSFPTRFKERVQALGATLVEVQGPMEIVPGIYSTGEMGRSIIEQSLVVRTPQGLVVVTGCAHPGIVSIVEQARRVGNGPIYLVMGGFHLGGASRAEIARIVDDFRRLEVQKVAPCHCTGTGAMRAFAAEYGEDYIANGAGKAIVVGR